MTVGKLTEALPPDAVLLHIGPYKTGSTALQAALFEAKPRLGEYGVAYPGRWRRIVGAGYAVLGWSPRGREVPEVSVWDNFAREVRKRDSVRVCVSTEDFSDVARADRFGRIVSDLGGERVHVVTVARAFHRLLPSFWQQSIKGKDTRTYGEWLHAVLDDDGVGRARNWFWGTNNIERTAAAWLPLVGPDRFRVVVADDSDPRYLLGVFEQLLGLPDGFLPLTDVRNASLTANGAEALRRLNARYIAERWSAESYYRLIQSGLIYGLQAAEPSPHDQKLPNLPPWAAERVRELTEDRIAALERLGVQVIGDPDRLRMPEDYQADATERATDIVPIDTVVSGLGSLLTAVFRSEERLRQSRTEAASRTQSQGSARPSAATKRHVLRQTESRVLVKELLRRSRRRLTRALPSR